MSFVLDASIALAWCFSDESTAFTHKLLVQLENDIALVPTIWSIYLLWLSAESASVTQKWYNF